MKRTTELPILSDLTLIITERCNLSCPFCYVPKTRGRAMSPKTALAAVDLLVDRAPKDAPLSLSFFGGEPFLQRELMGEVMAYARKRRPDGIRFGTPSNGTLLDSSEARQLIHANQMRLALSVDAVGGDAGHNLERLRPSLPWLREATSIVRMTVTPESVGGLFETIIALFAELGSTPGQKIMHQPALERRWPSSAVRAWLKQHQQLADWACERYGQGLPLPRLTVLEGIVGKLERDTAAAFCGAGSSQVAVDPDGKIFGCFRSAYDPRADQLVLAELRDGRVRSVNETQLAAYARLHPVRARPEQGACKACEARAGCTVYCPAMGQALLGDLRAVPADACTLMQIQVRICRDVLRRMRRIDRLARRRRVGRQVAAAALALSLAGGNLACGDSEPKLDGQVGGLCPVQADDGQVGGVCPMQAPDGAVQADGPVGGVCPVQAPDGAPPGDGPVTAQDQMVGGVCPAIPAYRHYKPCERIPKLNVANSKTLSLRQSALADFLAHNLH
jgi:uncharacterized protein